MRIVNIPAIKTEKGVWPPLKIQYVREAYKSELSTLPERTKPLREFRGEASGSVEVGSGVELHALTPLFSINYIKFIFPGDSLGDKFAGFGLQSLFGGGALEAKTSDFGFSQGLFLSA